MSRASYGGTQREESRKQWVREALEARQTLSRGISAVTPLDIPPKSAVTGSDKMQHLHNLLLEYRSYVAPRREKLGEEGEWYDWAKDFIYDLKRLLTLRNQFPILAYAHGFGYTHCATNSSSTLLPNSARFAG